MKEHFECWHGHTHAKERYYVIGTTGGAMTYDEFISYFQQTKTPQERREIHLRVNGNVHLEIAGRVEVRNFKGQAILEIPKIYSPQTREARLTLIEKKLGVQLQKHGH